MDHQACKGKVIWTIMIVAIRSGALVPYAGERRERKKLLLSESFNGWDARDFQLRGGRLFGDERLLGHQ
jgi:hypothetical protein